MCSAVLAGLVAVLFASVCVLSDMLAARRREVAALRLRVVQLETEVAAWEATDPYFEQPDVWDMPENVVPFRRG